MSFLPPLPPTFPAAFRDVDARRPEFRVAAAARLGAAATPDEVEAAVPALARLSRDALAPVREAALVAVGQLGRAELLTTAESSLSDPHPGVRRAAAIALGRIGGAAATARLRAAAADPRADLRAAAVLGLSCLNAPAEAPTLLPLLADEEPEVRALAAEALGELEDPRHADAVARLAADPDPGVARGATRALGRMRDPRAIPGLRALLRDRGARFEAVELLAPLRATEAREELAGLAGGRFHSLLLRAAAGGALAELGDPRGVDALRAVLRAVRSDGRGLAVELAGRLRLAALRPELERLARRPRGVEPARVAAALAELAPDTTRPPATESPRLDVGPPPSPLRPLPSAGDHPT